MSNIFLSTLYDLETRKIEISKRNRFVASKYVSVYVLGNGEWQELGVFMCHRLLFFSLNRSLCHLLRGERRNQKDSCFSL